MAIGFYDDAALGYRPPHPPIPIALFLVVEEAIVAAWEILRGRNRPNFDLATAHEDVVTYVLRGILYDEVFNRNVVDGFNHEVFAGIGREPKVSNFDESSLDKMPDMLIELINRPNAVKFSQDGIFVECKPVGRKHTVGVHYCGMGLIRFVRGDYAWAMTSALMVGYSESGYCIAPKLSEALIARAADITTLDPPHLCRRSRQMPHAEQVQTSRHGRPFQYQQTLEDAPPIEIRHLWLNRD